MCETAGRLRRTGPGPEKSPGENESWNADGSSLRSQCLNEGVEGAEPESLLIMFVVN